MKNRFIFMGNGPYLNHGCEAIVRGTVNIINKHFDKNEYVNATIFTSEEIYNEQKSKEINNDILTESIMGYKSNTTFIDKIKKKINKYYNKYSSRDLKQIDKYIDANTKAILSIGGDNYSLDYGLPDKFVSIDNYAFNKNKPLVIWGASVGPFTKYKDYEKYMSKHLKEVSAIFARETETVKYLDSIGIYNNVYRVCDPAFMLEAKKPINYNIEIEEGAIGINISPLMIKYVSFGNKDEFIKLAVKVVENIIKSTGRKIYFIPHVVISGNNDYEIMDTIYKNVDEKLKERITKVNDELNAAEYKWIISKMEAFFGARTHATIASLSTLVPTLSFVYSIKSVGINKDLFGKDSFCIYPEDFNEVVLLEKIKYLLDNKEKIQQFLKIKVNESKKLALKAGEYLKEIVD